MSVDPSIRSSQEVTYPREVSKPHSEAAISAENTAVSTESKSVFDESRQLNEMRAPPHDLSVSAPPANASAVQTSALTTLEALEGEIKGARGVHVSQVKTDATSDSMKKIVRIEIKYTDKSGKIQSKWLKLSIEPNKGKEGKFTEGLVDLSNKLMSMKPSSAKQIINRIDRLTAEPKESTKINAFVKSIKALFTRERSQNLTERTPSAHHGGEALQNESSKSDERVRLNGERAANSLGYSEPQGELFDVSSRIASKIKKSESVEEDVRNFTNKLNNKEVSKKDVTSLVAKLKQSCSLTKDEAQFLKVCLNNAVVFQTADWSNVFVKAQKEAVRNLTPHLEKAKAESKKEMEAYLSYETNSWEEARSQLIDKFASFVTANLKQPEENKGGAASIALKPIHNFAGKFIEPKENTSKSVDDKKNNIVDLGYQLNNRILDPLQRNSGDNGFLKELFKDDVNNTMTEEDKNNLVNEFVNLSKLMNDLSAIDATEARLYGSVSRSQQEGEYLSETTNIAQAIGTLVEFAGNTAPLWELFDTTPQEILPKMPDPQTLQSFK